MNWKTSGRLGSIAGFGSARGTVDCWVVMSTSLVDIPSSGVPKTPWATAEQRQLWRDVGIALLEGRVIYLTHQAFGAWCATEKFDMDRRYRSVSM